MEKPLKSVCHHCILYSSLSSLLHPLSLLVEQFEDTIILDFLKKYLHGNINFSALTSPKSPFCSVYGQHYFICWSTNSGRQERAGCKQGKRQPGCTPFSLSLTLARIGPAISNSLLSSFPILMDYNQEI